MDITTRSFVAIRFFEQRYKPGDSGWRLAEPNALRFWHHVPSIGDRIALDEIEGDREGDMPFGKAAGKVYEVMWGDDGVKVLLTW